MRDTHMALTIRVAGIAFSLMSTALTARAQEGPQPPPPFEQVYRMPAVYETPGMDKTQVRTDIVYRSVATPKGKADLKLDLYLPAGAKKGQTFAAVILISGGGIDGSDWRDAGVYKSYGRILAASGFAGVTFSKRYARGPEGTLSGIEDFHDLMASCANTQLNSQSIKTDLRFGDSLEAVSCSLPS